MDELIELNGKLQGEPGCSCACENLCLKKLLF